MLAGSLILFVAAVLIAVTGGFRTEILHTRVSAQWPMVSAVGSWALLAIRWWRSPDRAAGFPPFTMAEQIAERRGQLIAGAMAFGSGLLALTLGGWVAAGSDSYGYASQAMLWAQGNPAQLQTPLALSAPWPNGEWSFSPLGYKPSFIKGLLVPTYPAGLPLQMAILARPFGLTAAWLVMPALASVTVWTTYAYARRVSRNETSALVAAALTACGPVFLISSLQPMSDVPAAAWWLVSMNAALDATYVGALGSGLCASLAFLTRPNLVLLLLPIAAQNYFASPGRASVRLGRVALFGLGTIPGLALQAGINAVLYGSALASGYGSASAFFSLNYPLANLARYPGWLYSSYSPLIFLGVMSCLVIPWLRTLRDGERRRLFRESVLGLGLFAGLVASYLFYLPFEHWSYLRFLLPAIPVLLVLAVATLEVAARTISLNARALALTFVAMTLSTYYVAYAVHGEVFRVKPDFRDVYVTTGQQTADRTPASAVVISLLESGSLRFYGHRLTLRYDYLEPEWFDRAVAFLRQNDHVPYVALHSNEEKEFAERFPDAVQRVHASPRAALGSLKLVTLYGPLEPQNGAETRQGVPKR